MIALQKQRLAYRWQRDGVAIVTGSAIVQLLRQNGDDEEYLQADLVSWSTTPFDHNLALDSLDFWSYKESHAGVAFAWPVSSVGYPVWERAIHSEVGIQSTEPEIVEVSGDPAAEYLRTRRRQYIYSNLASYEVMYDLAGVNPEKRWPIYRNAAGTLPVRSESDSIVRRDAEEII